jgi:hypothetical protein
MLYIGTKFPPPSTENNLSRGTTTRIPAITYKNISRKHFIISRKRRFPRQFPRKSFLAILDSIARNLPRKNEKKSVRPFPRNPS